MTKTEAITALRSDVRQELGIAIEAKDVTRTDDGYAVSAGGYFVMVATQGEDAGRVVYLHEVA